MVLFISIQSQRLLVLLYILSSFLQCSAENQPMDKSTCNKQEDQVDSDDESDNFSDIDDVEVCCPLKLHAILWWPMFIVSVRVERTSY